MVVSTAAFESNKLSEKENMKHINYIFIVICIISQVLYGQADSIIVFDDGIALLRSGPLASDVGARTEYHYLPEAAPRSQWVVSTFRYTLPASWFIQTVDGEKSIYQRNINNERHWHPMVVSGNNLWRSYTVTCRMKPSSNERQSGLIFQYQHDRQYNIFCIEDGKLRLKQIAHSTSFRTLNEKILAEKEFVGAEHSWITMTVKVDANRILAWTNGGDTLSAADTLYKHGKIGLLADAPTAFNSISVKMSKSNLEQFNLECKTAAEGEKMLQQKQPQMKLWKKISTEGFGTGRNLRFGDLDNDGKVDVLVGQVVHYGPKDANSELSCLTAMTLDGKILWRIGAPDPWKTILTNDVAFQIHDIDHDGKAEVIYCMNQELIIADGSTGATKLKTPTPLRPGGAAPAAGLTKFKRILGDCIFFCDLKGEGWQSSIIVKDRYTSLWAFDKNLHLLWSAQCNTGHYPYAYDIDNDGKDEVMMGYTLFDDNGKKLWSLDSTLSDHADGVAIMKLKKNAPPVILCAASDEGMIFISADGKVLKHHYNGHIQNPVVANFRDDLPGLEVVSVNFWANQGIIQFYDSDGSVYYEFEPTQYGSMCTPVNWTGKTEEYVLLNANVDEGGLYDGWGRRALIFPDDGHPDMCCTAFDVYGDCRDEIIVWDPHEIWIYTQSDNPKQGVLYKPYRNPLWNESNYRANVSIPEELMKSK